MHRRSHSEAQNSDVKSFPRSETISAGSPCLCEDFPEEDKGEFWCVDGFECRNEPGHFGKMVHDDEDTVEAIGKW